MARKQWVLVVTAAVVALVWWQGGPLLSSLKNSGAPAKQSGARSAPVPVTITEVKNPIFPSTCSALGTVQPYRTVTLRSRVDGQITKVSFKQGQLVKEGDPLIEIDKRPYQAALDQVKAKKQLDQATLANPERPRPLSQGWNARRLAAANRHAESLVAQQQAQIGPTMPPSKRADPVRLHDDRFASHRQDRVSHRRSRQYRARKRPDRYRDDRPASADSGRADGARRAHTCGQ